MHRETFRASGPERRDRAITDRRNDIVSGLDMQTRRLKIGQRRQPLGIERCVLTNSDGVVRVGSSGCPFITKGNF